MNLCLLIQKIHKKGLRDSLRVLRERYLYCHWELLVTERPLDLPTPGRTKGEHWPAIRINRSHLPALERYFSHYRAAIDSLLNQGLRGIARINDQGDAIVMVWISERDYYDDQLYRCWVRLPPGCIYEFAGEVAPPYRGSSAALVIQRDVWKEYRQRGFHTSRRLVDTRNLPSMRMHAHLGFKETGEMVHVYRLFGCLHYNRTTPYREPLLPQLRRKKSAPAKEE